MNPTRVTVEVPSVVSRPSRSARSVVSAASRPVGSSQIEVPRAESMVVVQRISPTPASPKKKVVKKSKKRVREEEEETSANKKHRSNCKFFHLPPPLQGSSRCPCHPPLLLLSPICEAHHSSLPFPLVL
jgi:hypothetical protein